MFVLTLTACSPQPTRLPVVTALAATPTGQVATATPEPAQLKVLTVCIGKEPESLFLYADSSVTARSIREAIYDGPFDLRGYRPQPVILEKTPSSSAGDVVLEPIQVQPGDPIVDGRDYLATLAAGVSYLPSGCNDPACAQAYSGSQPASMDQLVIRFKLKPGITWSDGTPLKAGDSVYSYTVAHSLFSDAQSDLLAHTASYQALDESTLEWRGVPGYRAPLYSAYFFSPLPEHAWGQLSPQKLLTDERSARLPLGWGPYVIDEWVPGDHLTMHKNPDYFRAGEGLPRFDRLVFRFMPDGGTALDELLAEKCDLVDEAVLENSQAAELIQLQTAGKIALAVENGAAWEHADFGLLPVDTQAPNPFQFKEVRQAVALCLDRAALAKLDYPPGSPVSNTYLPPDHPEYAAEARSYPYDPQAAAQLLESAGWRDTDGNASTPRVAVGLPGIPPESPLQFTYLIDPASQKLAEGMQASLAACGMKLEIKAVEASELFAPGPEGPIFGRKFEVAGYRWPASIEPPCFLYSSSEIPGPYPEFQRGWGGANASGYNNPEFDAACLRARFSLPDTPGFGEAHRQAQQIYAEDLPSIPLFLRVKLAAMRPDLCGVLLDPSANSGLWNIEMFSLDGPCEP